MAALERFRGAVHQVKKRISEKKASGTLIEKAVETLQAKKELKRMQSNRQGALDKYVTLLDELSASLEAPLQGKEALTAATRAMEQLAAADASGLRAEAGYAGANAKRVELVERIAAVGARCPAWRSPAVAAQLAQLRADTTVESDFVGTTQKAEQDAQKRAEAEQVKGLNMIERARRKMDVQKVIKQNTREMADVLTQLQELLTELEQGLEGDLKGSAALNAAAKAMDRLEAFDAEYERDKNLRGEWYPTEQRQRLLARIVAVGARCPAWRFKGNGTAERVQKLGGYGTASVLDIERVLLEVETALTGELKGSAALSAVQHASAKLAALDSACGACEKQANNPAVESLLSKRSDVEQLIQKVSTAI